MEKDVDRIPKNADTDIVIRVDDFGGKRGVTIREFVRGERYTGFTKSGTRIPVEHFKAFKEAINSISEKDLMEGLEEMQRELQAQGNNFGASSNSGENKNSKQKEKTESVSKSAEDDIGEEEF